MTRANTARHSGDEFQARWFWLNAANLLDEQSSVSTIAWETGPKGLDDIRIDYVPARATPNGSVSRDYVQCKWHVSQGEYGYESLTDPKFVNATQYSWLQRAYEAFQNTTAESARYRLMSNWRVAAADPIGPLIRTESGALDIDKLFTGKTQNSATGKVRACWRSHLAIDDEELRAFAIRLSFANIEKTLEELRERLNERLAHVGLKRIPDHQSAFLYDDLVTKLHQQGPIELDEDRLRDLCDREDLWDSRGPTRRPFTLGIRSFVHRLDALEDRCDRLLDLVPHFDGRFLKADRSWDSNIVGDVDAFLTSVAPQHESIHLILDAHVSIAATVGRALDVKSGRSITVEQRTPGVGRQEWQASTGPVGAPVRISVEQPGDGDVVVALSITHNVLSAVQNYVASTMTTAHLMHVSGGEGPNAISIESGAHAWSIVEQVTAALRELPGAPGRRIHLFAAAPNALVLFLGQQLGLGPMTVYEWDFEGLRGGGYQVGSELD